MRRLKITAMVAVVAAAAVAMPAAAQSGRAAGTATYAAAPSVKRDSIALARALQASQRADRRWHSYDLAGAQRDYAQAVELLRSRGLYAGPTLVSLAHVTYSTDSPLKAARLLVDAAEDAAAFGDLALQAQSLFEASVLYSQGGDHGQAARLVEQTRKLLSSPYLPVEVKERIQRRMITAE